MHVRTLLQRSSKKNASCISINIIQNFDNFLIVDAYSNIPKLYGMDKITTEKVINKLDMFQSRFGKIDEFGWCDLEKLSAYAGTHFTSKEFKEECETSGVNWLLAAPEHQEINEQVEVKYRTLRTMAYSLMVHDRVLESYIHFALTYTTDHTFLVLPIKYMINEDGDPTKPHKLETGTKPSVSYLHVLFCLFIVQRATARVETKDLNMCHQAQKRFRGIFVGIPEHQKRYLVYVPSTRNILSSYDVVFDEIFSNALAYTPKPYSEAMAMHPAITYTSCATSSRKQTADIIMFAQFEEGNILIETGNDAESDDESDNESIIMSEQDIDAINSCDESDHDLISTEMLEDICDGSQTNLDVNKREACYKIHDRIRQRQLE